ncbi:MAG: PilX N-terminal domain-containing pilus assembly protein [Desulfoplanes sp.]
MKIKKRFDVTDNEKGMVLVVAILLLAALIILGTTGVMQTSTDLKISGNYKTSIQTFYDTEGTLQHAIGTPDTWLTTDFLTEEETEAFYKVDLDNNSVEIRCIEATGADIDELTDAANNLPAISHRDSPPAGSGYSAMHFEVHRYGITTTSAGGNVRIQTGVWKVFNKVP